MMVHPGPLVVRSRSGLLFDAYLKVALKSVIWMWNTKSTPVRRNKCIETELEAIYAIKMSISKRLKAIHRSKGRNLGIRSTIHDYCEMFL